MPPPKITGSIRVVAQTTVLQPGEGVIFRSNSMIIQSLVSGNRRQILDTGESARWFMRLRVYRAIITFALCNTFRKLLLLQRRGLIDRLTFEK